MLPAEDIIILICTRQKFDNTHEKKISYLCKKYNIRWDIAYFTAKQHGVSPLVHSNLKKCKNIYSAIDSDIKKKFIQDTIGNNCIKNIRYKKIQKLLSFFHEKFIDVMIIKGPALDYYVYKNKWATFSSDVDIILSKRREKVSNKEDAINFSFIKSLKCFEHGYYEHHDLDMNRILPIDYDKIWQEASSINYWGQTAFLMSPEDMLISVCINACRKRFMRLKSLCDISEIVQKYHDSMDWGNIGRKAKIYHCSKIIYTAFLATEITLKCKIPQAAYHSLEISSLRARMINYLMKRILNYPLSSLYSGPCIFGKNLNYSLLLSYLCLDNKQIILRLKVIFSVLLQKFRNI